MELASSVACRWGQLGEESGEIFVPCLAGRAVGIQQPIAISALGGPRGQGQQERASRSILVQVHAGIADRAVATVPLAGIYQLVERRRQRKLGGAIGAIEHAGHLRIAAIVGVCVADNVGTRLQLLELALFLVDQREGVLPVGDERIEWIVNSRLANVVNASWSAS